MKIVRSFLILSSIPLAIVLTLLFILLLGLKTIGSLIVKIVYTKKPQEETSGSKQRSSMSDLERRLVERLLKTVLDYVRDNYKDGISCLYIDTIENNFVYTQVELMDDLGEEVESARRLCTDMGFNMVALIFPHSIEDSQDLIKSLHQVKEGESFHLHVLYKDSVLDSNGGLMSLVFSSTSLSSFLVIAMRDKELIDYFLVKGMLPVQITH